MASEQIVHKLPEHQQESVRLIDETWGLSRTASLPVQSNSAILRHLGSPRAGPTCTPHCSRSVRARHTDLARKIVVCQCPQSLPYVLAGAQCISRPRCLAGTFDIVGDIRRPQRSCFEALSLSVQACHVVFVSTASSHRTPTHEHQRT